VPSVSDGVVCVAHPLPEGSNRIHRDVSADSLIIGFVSVDAVPLTSMCITVEREHSVDVSLYAMHDNHMGLSPLNRLGYV